MIKNHFEKIKRPLQKYVLQLTYTNTNGKSVTKETIKSVFWTEVTLCRKSRCLQCLVLTEESVKIWLWLYIFWCLQITGFTLRFSKRLQVNMMYGPSDVIGYVNQYHKLSWMHTHFADLMRAPPNMMSCVFFFIHRILNKIKEHTIIPILWLNEVSVNNVCIWKCVISII